MSPDRLKDHSRHAFKVWLLFTAWLVGPAVPSATAQFGGRGVPSLDVVQPSEYQVFQRGPDGTADIPIILDPELKGAEILSASISGSGFVPPHLRDAATPPFENHVLKRVPQGGPYEVAVRAKIDNRERHALVTNVFVGDLWALAGQSNMEGVGVLKDVTEPHPMVSLLGSDAEWKQAREPLHWLVDSPDPVHSGDPATREQRSKEQHKTRRKGAGLGLPFAGAMAEATDVPVGLIACAHGGTSLAQWDPAKKGEGGNSLYGSMLRQVKLAGGKVKGVLWYQGESDAGGPAADSYAKTFENFIAAVRSDFGQPDLPFYYVQIGRVVREGDPKGWNTVQEAQRRLVERVPNTAVVSVIDLELDDLIHVGTQGLKRAGRRLARVAQRELFGQVGATTPTLDRVIKGEGNALIVKFRGVNMSQAPAAPPRQTGAAPQEHQDQSATPTGLRPVRHIAGFSIRKEDGSEVPLIFEARAGAAHDAVVLELAGAVPEKSFLWYGHGLSPYCNLGDGLDMAVPVFGPVPLDGLKN